MNYLKNNFVDSDLDHLELSYIDINKLLVHYYDILISPDLPDACLS